jgi:hypothetical protein
MTTTQPTNETIGRNGQTRRGETPWKEAIMATTLDHARRIAASCFSDPAVDSVAVESWIGLLRVFRDGTVRFVADCPE